MYRSEIINLPENKFEPKKIKICIDVQSTTCRLESKKIEFIAQLIEAPMNMALQFQNVISEKNFCF